MKDTRVWLCVGNICNKLDSPITKDDLGVGVGTGVIAISASCIASVIAATAAIAVASAATKVITQIYRRVCAAPPTHFFILSVDDRIIVGARPASFLYSPCPVEAFPFFEFSLIFSRDVW